MVMPTLILALGFSWIESVRLARLGPVDYRLTVSARSVRPYARRLVSNDPPAVLQVNDVQLGPAVVVQCFAPQADSLFVVSRHKDRWVASETIYARYGIVVRHGRAGELSIEARVRNDRWPEEKGQPEWITERYILDRGELRRSETNGVPRVTVRRRP